METKKKKAVQIYLDKESDRYLDMFSKNGFSKSGVLNLLIKYSAQRLLDKEGNLRTNLFVEDDKE